jgi:hypothetical protein
MFTISSISTHLLLNNFLSYLRNNFWRLFKTQTVSSTFCIKFSSSKTSTPYMTEVSFEKESRTPPLLLPITQDADTVSGFIRLSGSPLKLRNQSLSARYLLWVNLFFVLHCIIARNSHDIVSCPYKLCFTKTNKYLLPCIDDIKICKWFWFNSSTS